MIFFLGKVLSALGLRTGYVVSDTYWKQEKLLVKKCQVATLSINKDLENEIVKAYKLSTEKKQINKGYIYPQYFVRNERKRCRKRLTIFTCLSVTAGWSSLWAVASVTATATSVAALRSCLLIWQLDKIKMVNTLWWDGFQSLKKTKKKKNTQCQSHPVHSRWGLPGHPTLQQHPSRWAPGRCGGGGNVCGGHPCLRWGLRQPAHPHPPAGSMGYCLGPSTLHSPMCRIAQLLTLRTWGLIHNYINNWKSMLTHDSWPVISNLSWWNWRAWMPTLHGLVQGSSLGPCRPFWSPSRRHRYHEAAALARWRPQTQKHLTTQSLCLDKSDKCKHEHKSICSSWSNRWCHFYFLASYKHFFSLAMLLCDLSV